MFNATCEICRIKEEMYVFQSEHCFAVMDKYPVNEGHMLIIPRRHIASYFDLEEVEIIDINKMLICCREFLDKEYKPDGYNVGVNIGEYAGQTIFHAHLHLIPRYIGDVDMPRGGIRNFKKSLVEY